MNVMTDYEKISLKLLVISAIFVVASILAVLITSLLTKNGIHPDFWKLGAPEKAILCLLPAAYGLTVFYAFRRLRRVKKKQVKSDSPNR